MNHTDHVSLLQKASIKPKTVWADLGSGDGAFTLALRDIGGKNIQIYSIDIDEKKLKIQQEKFNNQFPNTNIQYIKQDFTQNLNLPTLDGIIMANSLHFVKGTHTVVPKILKNLKQNGIFLLIEYNSDSGNQWVPYPISFSKFTKYALDWGLSTPALLHTVSSDFMNSIYAAEAQKL